MRPGVLAGAAEFSGWMWSEMQAGVAGFPYAGVVENQQV